LLVSEKSFVVTERRSDEGEAAIISHHRRNTCCGRLLVVKRYCLDSAPKLNSSFFLPAAVYSIITWLPRGELPSVRADSFIKQLA
jgi:hypothetical protein